MRLVKTSKPLEKGEGVMKCIKKGKEIKRVRDNDATVQVKNGWSYCPKHEWKKNVRNPEKESVE